MVALATTWFMRRGVEIHAFCMGVVDPDARRIYTVDVVGSREARLVLGVIYCTERRGAGWDEMAAHAEEIAEAARRTYGAAPVLAMLNISNGERLQGMLWPCDL